MSERKKRIQVWWIILLIVILVTGGILYFFVRPREPQVQLVVISRTTMQNKVFSSGYVRPVERQLVMPSQLTVPVSKFNVNLGSHVKPGQVLITGQNQSQAAALKAAKAAVASAEAGVASGPGLTSGQAQLAQAKAQLAAAQSAYDATLVQAQFAGTVILLNHNGLASDLSPAPYLEVVSGKKIAVNVSEVDAVQLHPGLVASLSSSAFPNQTWKATITQVQGYASTNSNGTGQVAVDLRVPDNFPVPLGYQVDVQIISSTHKRVPVVPYQALVQNGNNYSVFVYQNGRVHEVTVTLGITGNSVVEVTKGLSPGSKVVLNPPASLTNNEAVRASD